MPARLRSLDPRVADALLAAAFLVEALLELALLVPDGATEQGWAVLVVAAVAVALAFRRRPAAWLAVGPLFLALNQLPTEDYIDHLVSPLLALLVILYTAGRHASARALWPVAAFTVAVMIVSQAIDDYDDDAVNYLASALLTGGLMLFGRVMRNRSHLNRTLAAKAHRLEHERREQAAAVVEEERTRIAGELHDVVAHALSAMVVQASVARRLAAVNAPAAGEAFAAVETSGRDALVEIRSLLGVLRREDEEIALAPQPSLRHVTSLVQRMRAAGLETELVVEGEQRELPIGVDVTAYRVVQEALGGALEHGRATRARVSVRYAGDHVALEVVDEGDEPARPLLGIRERVALSGGHLQAGARRRGGHVVRARLPLGGSA